MRFIASIDYEILFLLTFYDLTIDNLSIFIDFIDICFFIKFNFIYL